MIVAIQDHIQRPTFPPGYSLPDAKEALGISDSARDPEVQRVISAAYWYAEEQVNVAYGPRDIRSSILVQTGDTLLPAVPDWSYLHDTVLKQVLVNGVPVQVTMNENGTIDYTPTAGQIIHITATYGLPANGQYPVFLTQIYRYAGWMLFATGDTQTGWIRSGAAELQDQVPTIQEILNL